MSPAFGLALMWLFSKMFGKGSGTTTQAVTPGAAAHPATSTAPMAASPAPAAQAQAQAHAAAAQAVKKPTPTNIHTAFAASDAAKKKLAQQAQEIRAAVKAPAPWQAALPKDLPPWPAGWEPDTPPPSAVVTRAWQLLPVLWKQGKGSKKVETIKGRWITFVAADHGGGKKGVTAFRVKGARA